jgi:hypothetical protein
MENKFKKYLTEVDYTPKPIKINDELDNTTMVIQKNPSSKEWRRAVPPEIILVLSVNGKFYLSQKGWEKFKREIDDYIREK